MIFMFENCHTHDSNMQSANIKMTAAVLTKNQSVGV